MRTGSKLFNACSLILIVLFLANCKDKSTETKPSDIKQSKGFFVINEGTFTIGNASLYYINLEDESKNTDEDLFKPANNRPLGDVFQSMTIINNNAWLVVNNSGKIEVIDPSTSKSISTIKGFKSPRYALEVLPGKVYVTDIYSNSISIVDANSFAKTGEIKCKGWTEELILDKSGKVWITNHNSKFVYIADPSTDKITDSVNVAYGGSGLLTGKDGDIWVLCSGDTLKNESGGLFCINPFSMKITKQFLFDKASYNPVKLNSNRVGDSLFYIYQGIYGFPKTIVSLPQTPFITQPKGSNFYGLSINPINGNLMVADAMDFVSYGKILAYSASGTLLKSYKAGVVPGNFYWW